MNLADLGKLRDSGELQLAPDPTGTRPQVMEVRPKLVEKFAGESLTEDVIANLLAPWESYERDSIRPNYEGRDEAQWIDDNKRIKDQLEKYTTRNELGEYGDAVLIANGFTNTGERRKILEDIENEFESRQKSRRQGKDPGPKMALRNQRFSVPNAKADENLSMAVLGYSGYEPVRELNSGNVQNTDIIMTLPNGVPVKVDAQMRTRGALELGVAQQGRYGFRNALINDPDTPLRDFLRKQLEIGNIFTEDKLLQTNEPGINMVKEYMGDRFMQGGGSVKDYIITSNRPTGDPSLFKGPYNPVKPAGWDLINLDVVRDIILPKSLNEIREFTGTNEPFKFYNDKGNNKMKLMLKNKLIKDKLTRDIDKLDPDIVRLLSQPPIKRLPRRRLRQ